MNIYEVWISKGDHENAPDVVTVVAKDIQTVAAHYPDAHHISLKERDVIVLPTDTSSWFSNWLKSLKK